MTGPDELPDLPDPADDPPRAPYVADVEGDDGADS